MAGAPQRELACPGGRARSQGRPVEARWALGHPLLEAAVSHATGGGAWSSEPHARTSRLGKSGPDAALLRTPRLRQTPHLLFMFSLGPE